MARNLVAPHLLSRKASNAISSQARVRVRPMVGGFILELEQSPLQADGSRKLVEVSSLAGWFTTREQADEASVAVLTALNALAFWRHET